MQESDEPTVSCDQCGKDVAKSKIIQDKGVDYPELIKKAKEEGRDHIELCPDCAGRSVDHEQDEDKLDSEMSNIRQFL